MTKTKIKVCGHYVLVEPEAVEKKTESGIITGTPNQHKQEETAKMRGTLVGKGPNAWKAFNQGEGGQPGKPWAKIGDTVYFKRHVSDKIEDESIIEDGKPKVFFLLNDENILAVIED
jgi:co-chaperonin GroES (HSP10)